MRDGENIFEEKEKKKRRKYIRKRAFDRYM